MILGFAYVKELAADLHRLGLRNRRLYAGLVTVALLVGVLVLWRGAAFVKALLTQRGVAVSGEVRWQNLPLARGRITFLRSENLGERSPAASSPVVAGRYRVPNPPGLEPGRYVVKIRSLQPPAGSGHLWPPSENSVPPEFNDESELRIEVQRFGRNRFDFDLPRAVEPAAAMR